MEAVAVVIPLKWPDLPSLVLLVPHPKVQVVHPSWAVVDRPSSVDHVPRPAVLVHLAEAALVPVLVVVLALPAAVCRG